MTRLIVVTLLLAVVAIVLKMRNRNTTTLRAIKITSRTTLSRGSMLAVVEIDGRRLLVGAAPNQVNLIAELADTPPVPEDGPGSTAPQPTATAAAIARLGSLLPSAQKRSATPVRPSIGGVATSSADASTGTPFAAVIAKAVADTPVTNTANTATAAAPSSATAPARRAAAPTVAPPAGRARPVDAGPVSNAASGRQAPAAPERTPLPTEDAGPKRLVDRMRRATTRTVEPRLRLPHQTGGLT